MVLEFVDPRPPTATMAETSGRLRTVPAAGAITIGMLANGFPDSARFLEHLASAIGERSPRCSFRSVTKSSPPLPLTGVQRDAMASCHAVVAAYGH